MVYVVTCHWGEPIQGVYEDEDDAHGVVDDHGDSWCVVECELTRSSGSEERDIESG